MKRCEIIFSHVCVVALIIILSLIPEPDLVWKEVYTGDGDNWRGEQLERRTGKQGNGNAEKILQALSRLADTHILSEGQEAGQPASGVIGD